MNELALRYSTALYSLAVENNKVECWQKEIKELMNLIKENPDFLNLLSSNFLSLEKRKEILSSLVVFDDAEINSFLNIILDNNRINFLNDILESFNSLCNKHLGILEGIVFSVEKLSDEQINSLELVISKKESIKIELKNIIDKSLIGGIKVLINDHVYDNSIKLHLQKLKSTLRK